MGAHPAAVTLDGGAQSRLPLRARRAHGGEDAAAGRVQLLVRRAARAQRELLDPVAAEGDVGVAVDEAGDRAAAPSVHLDDVAVERLQVAHTADGRDRVVLTQDVRVPDHVDLAELRSA